MGTNQRASSSEVFSTAKTWTKLRWSRGPQKWPEGGASHPWGKSKGFGAVQPGEEKSLGKLNVTFQYLKRAYKKQGVKHFRRTYCNRTRAKGFKFKEGRFRLDLQKTFFYDEGKCWNQFPRVADDPVLKAFKVRWDRALSNLI